MKMILLIIGIIIGFMIVPVWMKVKNKQVKFTEKPLYTPQELTDFEKEYPIHDGRGNYFKTMPEVYSKTLYLSNKTMKTWRCPSDCWATISQLWVDGKQYKGITVIQLHSYKRIDSPMVATISVTGALTYNGSPIPIKIADSIKFTTTPKK